MGKEMLSSVRGEKSCGRRRWQWLLSRRELYLLSREALSTQEDRFLSCTTFHLCGKEEKVIPTLPTERGGWDLPLQLFLEFSYLGCRDVHIVDFDETGYRIIQKPVLNRFVFRILGC